MFGAIGRRMSESTTAKSDVSIMKFNTKNTQTNSVHWEIRIKDALVKCGESYDGIGNKMIETVKELCHTIVASGPEETNMVYTCIAETMAECICTLPYKTGIYAGLTALMSTSLMEAAPLAAEANVSIRIIKLCVEIFLSEFEKSNFHLCKNTLLFFTELANFYVIDSSQLFAIYNIILQTGSSIEDTFSYNGVSHHSFILFSIVAYTLPYIRDEIRFLEDKGEIFNGQKEEYTYAGILREMDAFYNSNLLGYLEFLDKLLLEICGERLVMKNNYENPFKKYWEKLLEWQNQGYPRIQSILRFYRSEVVSIYSSQIPILKDCINLSDFEKIKTGCITKYLPSLLVRFPRTDFLDISEYLTIHIMDNILISFMESPYESARQLLKLPIIAPSYDICLSICLWNALLNPYTLFSTAYMNLVTVNLIKLQGSFLKNVWAPIWLKGIVDIYIEQPWTLGFEFEKDKLFFKGTLGADNFSIQSGLGVDEVNSQEDGKSNDIDDKKMNVDPISPTNIVINYKIFPSIYYLSVGMLKIAKRHIAYILALCDTDTTQLLKKILWENETFGFAIFEMDNSFVQGFISLIVNNMCRLLLPQTLRSIPNEQFQKIARKFLISSDSAIIPKFFDQLREFNKLRELLLFKLNSDVEVEKQNILIVEYLRTLVGQKILSKTDPDEDNEVAKRYEERIELSDKIVCGDYRTSKRRCTESTETKTCVTEESQISNVWSAESLFDLLLVTILYQGNKSMSHLSRLFANYKSSISLFWKIAEEGTESQEYESKVNSLPTSQFTSCVRRGTIGVLEIINNGKVVISNREEIAELRLLCILFVLWGGITESDLSFCMGNYTNKIRIVIFSAINEGTTSTSTVSKFLAYILSSKNFILSLFNIIDIGKRYQLFIEYFELLTDLLDRELAIQELKRERKQDNTTNIEDESKTLSEDKELYESTSDLLTISNMSFSELISDIILILLHETEKRVDEQISKLFDSLILEVATFLCVRFGFWLQDIVESNNVRLSEFPSVFGILKKFYEKNLGHILFYTNSNLKFRSLSNFRKRLEEEMKHHH
ncbi:hypothetical protein cand_031700 [Cryptosporidium andersoni]|uniref:Uncharacterized protein n=1 Tax=Cryptosporidium andersoni TaxID=117008 RepID=A0A1J4MB55_9CRYT|nr:hypothetical protein cand_031700 [Cryptosporidium andersoni]